jgi:hypothetical protein
MKLKNVTLFAAVTQLLTMLCLIASDIHGLMQLSSGHMSLEDNWMYFLSMPIYFLSNIALNVFLFTLAAKQKNN